MSADDSNEYQRVRVFASLPKTQRGMPVVVGLSPKRDKITYTNGNSVFILDLDNHTDTDIYTEHPVATTVAKISPSGYYCASGDNAGNIRLWDMTNSTHILKATYHVFSGPVRDIAWNDDSKRVAVVGEGRERFGHVFLFDTGTSNGNLTGQSRAMNSIDFKPTRPYRLISASEDNTVGLFEGPPFKYTTTFQEHTRFVHVVRYNNDGSLFASAGADGKVYLYAGTDGAKKGELVDDSCKGSAHSGSVFGMTWSPDGSKLATASGDKTVKIWNAADRSLEKVITLGSDISDQQLSVAWSDKYILSVSLAGFVNYIDPSTGKVIKTLHGHNKPITAMAASADRSKLYTSDFEGNITVWDVATGSSERVNPVLHKSQVIALQVTNSGSLISSAWDDTTKFTKNPTGTPDSSSVKLPSQPLGHAASADGSITVVGCHKHIVVMKDGKVQAEQPFPSAASCVAISPDNSLVVVGSQESKLFVYGLSGYSLTEKTVLTHAGPLTAVCFSNDGKHFVATDSARKVVPYSVSSFEKVSLKDWTFHTAKVNCVAFSPDNRHIATGGLDTNIIVWDLQKSGDHPIIIKGAHAMSPINAVLWLNDRELVSAGQDANIKHFKINF